MQNIALMSSFHQKCITVVAFLKFDHFVPLLKKMCEKTASIQIVQTIKVKNK